MTPSIIKSIDLLIQYRELIGVSDVSHVVAVSQILDLSSNELEWVAITWVTTWLILRYKMWELLNREVQ